MGYEDRVMREEDARRSYKKAAGKKGGNKYAVRDRDGKEVIISVVAPRNGLLRRVTEATTTVTDRKPMELPNDIGYSRAHAISVKPGERGREEWRAVETITTVEPGGTYNSYFVSGVMAEDIEWHTRLLKSARPKDVIVYDTGNPKLDGKTRGEIKAAKCRGK